MVQPRCPIGPADADVLLVTEGGVSGFRVAILLYSTNDNYGDQESDHVNHSLKLLSAIKK